MSRLENVAKPILTPIVQGAPIGLVMIFDWLGERYWRPDERWLLREDPLALLSNVMVVAADHTGNARATVQPSHQTIAKLGGENTGIPMFRGIMTVGRALFMVQADRYKEATGRNGIVWPPKHYDRTVLLQRPGAPGISWPPPQSIDDEAFREFIGDRQD